MYINVPEIVIQVAYIDSMNSHDSYYLNSKFKSDLPMGLISDSVRNSVDFKKAKLKFDASFKRLQEINKLASKNSDYNDYRKKWRNKTMMQPKIIAVRELSKEFGKREQFKYEDFKELFLIELKKQYVEKHGEILND